MADLLKVDVKKEVSAEVTSKVQEKTEAFTPDALRNAWDEFAAARRHLQAEYHLLTQTYDILETRITLHLLSPVQETMLNGFRADLIAHLRAKLNNDLIQVVGELGKADDKKVIYTPRDKFEYLQGKIPILKEFKDRLGLDTDY